MIVATATDENDGRRLLILGLNKENVERLMANQPIRRPLDDAGFPNLTLVILYGETYEDIQQDLHIISRGGLPK